MTHKCLDRTDACTQRQTSAIITRQRAELSRVKVAYGSMALNDNPSQSYGASTAI